MSSRVLKKLSVKIQEPNEIDDELESDTDLVIPTKKQLNINRYDLVRASYFLEQVLITKLSIFVCDVARFLYLCRVCLIVKCFCLSFYV